MCHDCAVEAEDLVTRGAISAFQAEAMALYCTQCASLCDGCGRQQQLCPDGLRKARSKRLFKQTLATMARLFAEDDERSQPKQQGPYHGS
jgi:hypothetical protein